jgi:hypothetical protein
MQFTVQLPANSDEAGIAEAFARIDPSIVMDLDPAGLLRIAAVVDEALIAQALRDLGFVVAEDEVVRLPSECCGGCGG